MPPKRPIFRFHNKQTGELVWAATDRAKEVADLIKKRKGQGAFGPKLSKEQVCTCILHNLICIGYDDNRG